MAYPAQWIAETRERILADPFFLAGVLGIKITWFHRRWWRFCMENPKHVLEAGRGFGKSTVVTTLLVIHAILCDPNLRVLLVSRTEGQASRLLKEIRGHLESNEILKACFGPFVGTGSWTDTALVIAQRTRVNKEATVSAMGLEGQITGGHWELIIVDDPFDEESSRTATMRDRAYEWLFNTLQPAMMPGGSIGFRCTRYHYNDMAGRIERELATDSTTGECYIYRLEDRDQVLPIPRDAAWKVLQTPAIGRDGASLWEDTFPLRDRVDPNGKIVEGLARKRHEMGERRFGEQFMMICNEVKEGETETEFKRAWFRAWTSAPDRSRLEVYQRVDPAFRDREQAAQRTKRDRDPDFYAIGVVGFDRASERCYVLDAFKDRCTPLEREARAKEYADRHHPRLVEVERTGLQIREAPGFYAAILDALRPHRARFGQPRRDKVADAQPFARALEAGRVEWNPELFERYPGLIDGFAAFPFGAHDDLEDVLSRAYLLGERRRSVNLRSFGEQAGGAWRGGETETRRREVASTAARTVGADGGGYSSRAVPRAGFGEASGGRAVPR